MADSVRVDGREVPVTSLDKVLYPASGTTKGEVITYLVQAAPVLLPELAGRPVTRVRWPAGVGGDSFFEKNAPRGMPSWVPTVELDSPGSTRDRERVRYPLVDSVATLVWLGQVGALELHVPQWRVSDAGEPLAPDRLVVDLDPGPGAGLAECAQVALAARELLEGMGLGEPVASGSARVPGSVGETGAAGVAGAPGSSVVPVTSGSKGMQLYAPLPGVHSAEQVRELAHGLARALEEAHPGLVVSSMSKAVRRDRVLVDWSQNSATKTTICPWSPRGRHPWATVAAPRRWDEVEAAASGSQELRQLTPQEALARVS